MYQDERFVYDRTLRELFQGVPKTLIRLVVGHDIKEILDISFPKVKERRVDLLARLDDDTLFHLEIQSTDDKEMPVRMLNYATLIYQTYKEFPRQLVLYVGDNDIDMTNGIIGKNIRYNYEVKSIKEFDCSLLIESDDIADNIIAVLCDIKDIDKLFKKLRVKLTGLNNKEREDYLRKLFYLLRLRPNLNRELKEKSIKELPMPFTIEKDRDPLYREGIEKGIERGIEKGIERGIEKGKKEGYRLARIESAIVMIKDFNIEPNEVAKKFDLPLDLILKYKK